MWRWLLGLAILAGVATGVVLGALNPDPVTLRLAIFEWTATLGAVVAASAGAGFLLGLLMAAVLMAFRRKSRRTRLERTPEASQSLTDA